MTEEELISACQREERDAQFQFYERYSPMLFGLCRRYISSREDAEDVLIEAFYKIFTNIDSYEGKGSFEGWIKRIVVNEALMFLRKRHALQYAVEITEQFDLQEETTAVDELAAQDILDLMDQLPTGYRTVFNLYVLEGYKHREIADLLGISINTSKSQLILAKKRLREALISQAYPGAADRVSDADAD